MFKDLRAESLKETLPYAKYGIGIGGLSVGEPKSVMYDILDSMLPNYPTNIPRYLMGVGDPYDIFEGVEPGDLPFTVDLLFTTVRPFIDADIKRKRGGAPLGNSNATKQPKNNLENNIQNNLKTNKVEVEVNVDVNEAYWVGIYSENNLKTIEGLASREALYQ